jgi:DNA-binding response OmpR family regulator
MKPRILFIEDSDDLGLVVKQLLEINGFSVERCIKAQSAYEYLLQNREEVDLIIIDIGLPDIDGFQFTEMIRNLNSGIPFLYLTARAEKTDRIRGLQYGASDYITKPFDIEELLLRIRNILHWQKARHSTFAEQNSDRVQLGDVVFFKGELAVSLDGGPKELLTRREAEVLEYLMRYSDRIVKKDELLQEYWGSIDYFKGRSLDTYIGRLKKLLQRSRSLSIENRYGVGWTLAVKAGPAEQSRPMGMHG